MLSVWIPLKGNVSLNKFIVYQRTLDIAILWSPTECTVIPVPPGRGYCR